MHVDAKAGRPLSRQPGAAALLAKAARQGRLPVIVGIDMSLQDGESLTAAAFSAQQQALRAMQESVLQGALGHVPAGAKFYQAIPFFAVAVSRAQLARLMTDRRVISIVENVLLSLTLLQSTDVINAPNVWSSKHVIGRDQVVAVLDTGVDADHPMLKGKVVSEACYGTNLNPPASSTSLCPNGATESNKAGSGANCPPNIDFCYHGTHVASTAVGRSAQLRGVAPGAKLISIKIVSRVESAQGCGNLPPPCLAPWVSDVIKGLDRVHALRNKFNIAAVNLSLSGNSSYTNVCNSLNPPMDDIIGKLRKAGIATVASTGNNSTNNAINFPACIKDAVSVGATSDDDFIWSATNYSWNTKLLAPGVDIRAGVPKGSTCGPGRYCTLNGTSQAAPHVAGALALLREAKPDATVRELMAALSCTGKPVLRQKQHRPRIDVLKAYRELLKEDPTEAFDFTGAAEGKRWDKVLGTWQVQNGNFEAVGWPAEQDRVLATLDYCSASFRFKALMTTPHVAGFGNGDAGLILISNIGTQGATLTASGYYFFYSESFRHVVRLDNFALAGAHSGIGGTMASVCPTAAGVDTKVPHIVEVIVRKDGEHTFLLDQEVICTFVDRVHAPPKKIGILHRREQAGLDDYVFSVKKVTVKPIR